MGRFDVNVETKGVVTAKFVNDTTVQFQVELTHNLKIEDEYDWHPEKGWGVNIGPIFLPDSVPDSLRKVGARPFTMKVEWQETETRTFIFVIDLERSEGEEEKETGEDENRNSARREGRFRRDLRRRGRRQRREEVPE